jgi:hypothetical protein
MKATIKCPKTDPRHGTRIYLSYCKKDCQHRAECPALERAKKLLNRKEQAA